MKRPEVDYRHLRLSNITSPEYRHVLLLLGWVFYFVMYFLTENLIPYEACHLIHSPLDDLVPFCEYFAVFYVFWYVLVFGSLLYYFFYDVESFRRLQIFIIVTQVVAMAVYIIYPSCQDMRPEVVPRDNFLSHVMAYIYSFDTPTGICPSLHVGYSLGILSVCWKDKRAPLPWKAAVFILVILISMSTAFVKQHSVVDILAAVPLGLLAEIVAYSRSYWLPKLKKRA